MSLGELLQYSGSPFETARTQDIDGSIQITLEKKRKSSYGSRYMHF
ncbi:hypothetical protein M1349_02790 [Patescibacteria group bacterium]|nr:hypothetical protein [Patescibacteria group bacterium]